MNRSIQSFRSSSIKEAVWIHQQCLPMPWSENIFQEALEDPTHIGFEGLVDDALIGFIIGRRVLQEAEILTLAIHKNRQRTGVGAKLLSSFLTHAKQEGARTVFLEVQASNIPALELYRSFDFEKIGERANYYPAVAEHSRIAQVLQKTFF